MVAAWRERALFIGFGLALIFLAYLTDRSSLSQVLLGYGASFAIYFHWTSGKEELDLKKLLFLAFVSRAILLFSIPNLSDDYFRFIWDGLLQLNGENPFAYLPSEIHRPEWQGIYDGLNSSQYYSVYPPVMQWMCSTAAWVGGVSVTWNVVILRLILLSADLILIYFGWRLLELLGKRGDTIFLYALNPLVIIEGTGNLHFEVLMMSFTIVGLYFLVKSDKSYTYKYWIISVSMLALGIATKLISALLMPSLLRKLGIWRTIAISLSVALITISTFALYIDSSLLLNFADSLNLYFRNFQFNSSMYNLVDYFASFHIRHYRAEVIGPWISLVGVISIVAVIVIRKIKTWEEYFETLLFVFSLHLLFASTVHPWYVINLLLISLFTSYRYPVLFSFTVVFSYHFYDLGYQSPFFLCLEYLPVLAYGGYELWYRPQRTLAA